MNRILLGIILSGLSFASHAADGYQLLSTQSGRFVYGWTGGSAKTAMMLDTQTGRLWKTVCIVSDENFNKPDAPCLYSKLEPIYFGHDGGEVSLTPDGKKYRMIDSEAEPSKN